MLSSAMSTIFSVTILLLLTATSESSDCYFSQTTCYSGLASWCCSSDETCGSSFGRCNDSLDLPPAVIAVIIVASIFCFVTCLSCCIQSHQRQQRLHATMASPHGRFQVGPYQNSIVRGPMRVIHVRPVSHVGGSPAVHNFPTIYEAPPPSYEAAVALPLPSTPPMTATVEQSSSSVV